VQKNLGGTENKSPFSFSIIQLKGLNVEMQAIASLVFERWA